MSQSRPDPHLDRSVRHRQTVTVRAPAKINLLLYVLDREPTGYHRIVSLMQMVGLYDRLRLIQRPLRDGIRLVTQSRAIPRGRDNLIVRAARAFMNRYGIKTGLRIELEKKIPTGAGLGGGSGDAAATLRGLCRLYRLDPPRTELMMLGQSLGSDVPFFFQGPTAWVSGIGDEVYPVTLRDDVWTLLVHPGFEVSTAWAYSELDRTWRGRMPNRRTPLKKMGLTLENDQLKIIPHKRRAFLLRKRSFSLHNDLETITIGRYPVIAAIKEHLRSLGAEAALMSGSGPAVFGLFPDRLSASRAGAFLRRDGRRRGVRGRRKWPADWQVWVVRLLHRSPW